MIFSNTLDNSVAWQTDRKGRYVKVRGFDREMGIKDKDLIGRTAAEVFNGTSSRLRALDNKARKYGSAAHTITLNNAVWEAVEWRLPDGGLLGLAFTSAVFR